MKHISYFLLLLCVLEQSCGSPRIYKKTKITRTVSKAIDLNFSVNQVGDLKTFQLITGRDIIEAFYGERPDISILSTNIETIDVRGVKIGADVLTNNSASQVVLSADVLTGALLDKPFSLLNKTKTIIITKDKGFDFKNALDNVVDGIKSDDETDKENNGETKLYNALTILNATGTAELKKILAENLTNINRGGLRIQLNGTVPAGQRLVMSLTIRVDASMTFSRCEEVEVFRTEEAVSECN